MNNFKYEFKFDNRKYFEHKNKKSLKKNTKKHSLSRSNIRHTKKSHKYNYANFDNLSTNEEILNYVYNFYEKNIKEYKNVIKYISAFNENNFKNNLNLINAGYLEGVLPLFLYRYITNYVCSGEQCYYQTAELIYKNHINIIKKLNDGILTLSKEFTENFNICGIFINKYIKLASDGSRYIEIGNLKILPLHKSVYLNQFSIILIDIVNRYFSYINDTLNTINFGFYPIFRKIRSHYLSRICINPRIS